MMKSRLWTGFAFNTHSIPNADALFMYMLVSVFGIRINARRVHHLLVDSGICMFIIMIVRDAFDSIYCGKGNIVLTIIGFAVLYY